MTNKKRPGSAAGQENGQESRLEPGSDYLSLSKDKNLINYVILIALKTVKGRNQIRKILGLVEEGEDV